MPDPTIPRRGNRPPPQQQQQRPRQARGSRSADVARALGGDEAWVKKIRSDGAGEAVTQWVETVDKGGGTATMFRLLQQFGHWFEDRAASGRPPNQGEIQQAIEKLAQKYGVDPEAAEKFVMNALREVQTAAQKVRGPGEQRPSQPQQQVQPQPQPRQQQGQPPRRQ